MRIMFLIDNYRRMRVFPPIAGHGLYGRHRDILRRIHQKDHCYKNFREQDMA